MRDFDSDIETVQADIRSYHKKQEAMSEVLDKSGSKIGKLGIDLDIENAKLSEVTEQQETMNTSIAGLIIDLDAVTNGFGAQFNEMREKTITESLVGFFSGSKSEAMRESRIRNTDIEGNLNELISKSNTIVTILQEQLGVLDGQLGKTTSSLEAVLDERVVVVTELEVIRTKIGDLDPKLIVLENEIANETNAGKRTKLEKKLQKLNEQHNALINDEQVKTALSQTFEKYIKMYQTFVDSLANQKATQIVLIDKLQTDTKQRTVLYDALTKSLVTAQQQDVAHQINEIGSAVDNEAQTTMAHIGSATNQRMAEMMEAHEDNMVYAAEVQKEKAKSDDRFARRFAKIIAKHDAGDYGGKAA